MSNYIRLLQMMMAAHDIGYQIELASEVWSLKVPCHHLKLVVSHVQSLPSPSYWEKNAWYSAEARTRDSHIVVLIGTRKSLVSCGYVRMSVSILAIILGKTSSVVHIKEYTLHLWLFNECANSSKWSMKR